MFVLIFFISRHNNYIQEATSHIEPTFHNTVHDLRLLLERFAFGKSFNEDSGGGGRQSNFNIMPYMVHMGLYIMNTWVLATCLRVGVRQHLSFYNLLLDYFLYFHHSIRLTNKELTVYLKAHDYFLIKMAINSCLIKTRITCVFNGL